MCYAKHAAKRATVSSTLKIVIGVGAALVIGFLAGFLAGHSGRSEAEDALQKAKNRAAEAEDSLKREGDECKDRLQANKTSRQLLLAKEELLRAVVEIYGNNYGLTSQHLAQARSWLRSAQKGLKAREGALARDLYDKIGEAQTLAMRLDPNARARIVHILGELQRLPGAR